MVLISEVFKGFDEGFTNKNSSKLAEFFTDDVRFVTAKRTMNKEEIMDWTAGGGNQTVLSNLEVLHETDEVSVTCHTANSTLGADGLVMVFYTKRDGKISHGRVVRQEL